MKVLVTGVNGQLGYDVVKELKRRKIAYIAAGRTEFDITDADATKKIYKRKYAGCGNTLCSIYGG